MESWDGTDRRERSDRRKEERRRSMRYLVDTLIVIDGVTWVDTDGSNRRRKIRRRDDRERLAKKISADFSE